MNMFEAMVLKEMESIYNFINIFLYHSAKYKNVFLKNEILYILKKVLSRVVLSLFV